MDNGRIKIGDKERRRASEDGIVIVVRPNAAGGCNVIAVRLDGTIATPWPRERVPALFVPAAVTSVGRDLDKFCGAGGQMAAASRHRSKEVWR